MRNPTIISALVLLFCISSCGKYDEELDCHHIPWWRDCDAMDDEPTEFTLTIVVNTTDPMPMDVKIFNRTLAFGIGNLHTTVSTYGNSTHILPSGRYTAEMTFSNDSIVQQDFRLHNNEYHYCEGTCYVSIDDDILMTGP